MSKLALVLAGAGLFFSLGCATKVKILDAASVSNTHYNQVKNTRLKSVGDISGEFCQETFGESNQGLLDNAITQAQKKNKVHFISNVSFFAKGGCVTVEGEGFRMVRARKK